jgi:hypothetical protein
LSKEEIDATKKRLAKIQTHPFLLGGPMKNSASVTHGIELLLKKYRNEFRCPENTDYYNENDYKEAERKFVKFCLSGKVAIS